MNRKMILVLAAAVLAPLCVLVAETCKAGSVYVYHPYMTEQWICRSPIVVAGSPTIGNVEAVCDFPSQRFGVWNYIFKDESDAAYGEWAYYVSDATGQHEFWQPRCTMLFVSNDNVTLACP